MEHSIGTFNLHNYILFLKYLPMLFLKYICISKWINYFILLDLKSLVIYNKTNKEFKIGQPYKLT